MARQIAASTLGAPSGTYLFDLAANNAGSILATIGSDDSIRMFDPSLVLPSTVTGSHSGVCCLAGNDKSFVTAGRDGLIKIWNAQNSQTIAQLTEPQGRGISAISCAGEHCIAAGTESLKEGLGDVAVHIYDTRNVSQPFRTYPESHTDSITTLTFHPEQNNVLLSGSTDGLVSILDITHEDEDDALQQVLNPRSAVHRSGFLTSDQVYVLTTDEQLLLYRLADDDQAQSEPVLDLGDIRGALGCMYAIDIFQPQKAPMIAHGHNENSTLALTQLNGGSEQWHYGDTVALPGAHGDDVVRDLLFAPDLSKTWSCGEDGNVRLWDLTDHMTHESNMDAEKTPKKKKREKKGERFTPY